MSMKPTTTGSVLIVIPCRLGSSRLPNKPLLKAGDKPLVQWTYEQAKKTGFEVVVATDEDRIIDVCRTRSIPFFITQGHPTGTSRCKEPARLSNADRIVNWQVDEPEFPPGALVDALTLEQHDNEVVTFVGPITNPEDWYNPHIVKAWPDRWSASGVAFSRNYGRDLAHIGIYIFNRESLLSIRNQATPPQGLEQTLFDRKFVLRHVDEMPLSINTKADWAEFKRRKESQ